MIKKYYNVELRVDTLIDLASVKGKKGMRVFVAEDSNFYYWNNAETWAKEVNVSAGPKQFLFKFQQTGTSAPTLTIIHNSLGLGNANPPVRNQAGVYTFNFGGYCSFDPTKILTPGFGYVSPSIVRNKVITNSGDLGFVEILPTVMSGVFLVEIDTRNAGGFNADILNGTTLDFQIIVGA